MLPTENSENLKRLPIKLTIREDILQDAKSLNLNASKAAEAGISEAIKTIKAEQWLKENKSAIHDYNKELRERGLTFIPRWLEKADM